jgi:lysophospholipase L1-like esterase
MQGGHVALFTIFLGANDAVAADWKDENGQPIKTQHVPIARYTANLKRMVAMLRQHQPQAEIVIITPPKVHVCRGNNPVVLRWGVFVLTLTTPKQTRFAPKTVKCAIDRHTSKLRSAEHEA